MTPQPQQRYIITEDIIRMFEEECFKACKILEHKDNCKDCQFEPKSGPRTGCCNFGKDELVKLLRSRPAPSPEQCPYWKMTDNLKSDCRDQNLGRYYCAKSNAEHDAAIAAQVRNQMLADIPDVLICQHPPNGHGFCGNNDCICKEIQRIEGGDICKWMQSLRNTAAKGW